MRSGERQAGARNQQALRPCLGQRRMGGWL